MQLTMRYFLLCSLSLLFCVVSPTVNSDVKSELKPQTVMRINFGKMKLSEVTAHEPLAFSIITSQPTEEVDGTPSLMGDSRGSSNEWNEFFHSKPGIFKANTAYTVTFNYKIVSTTADTEFYALFRRDGTGAAPSSSFTILHGSLGHTQTIKLSFSATPYDDFALIFGIENKGALSINNIVIKTDPQANLPTIALPSNDRIWKAVPDKTYYVNSTLGNDASNGLSPNSAWRTFRHINNGTFVAGDKILLHCGSDWQDCLAPAGSGSVSRPITISSYGTGRKPRIDCAENYRAAVYIHNTQYIQLDNISISNAGPYPLPQLTGVEVEIGNYGTAHNIVMDNLTIHDVDGSLDTSPVGGAGIRCIRDDYGKLSCYDGLVIENCHLIHIDRDGIIMDGNVWRTHWHPNLHVIIRNNLLQDIGGSGIVPIACDGAIVEHNAVQGACMRTTGYAVGIFPWSCDNTIVQYNDVSGVKFTRDGQGYDCDFNCRNTLMQYNYSHNNAGGFMLICDDGTFKSPMSAGNQGSIIRYNVSVNDGFHTFSIYGPCTNTQIYNNTIYVGIPQKLLALSSTNWDGPWPSNTLFANNIFYYAKGTEGTFDFGDMTNLQWKHNAFWGDYSNRPDETACVLLNPRFVDIGGDLPQDYALQKQSPCLSAGEIIDKAGVKDFSGHWVTGSINPSIGAFQNPGTIPKTRAK